MVKKEEKMKVKEKNINVNNRKNKIIKLKCYFMILNLVVSLIAFSVMVSGESKEDCPDGRCLPPIKKTDIKKNPPTTNDPTSSSGGSNTDKQKGSGGFKNDDQPIENADDPGELGGNNDGGLGGKGGRGEGNGGDGGGRYIGDPVRGEGKRTIFDALNNFNLYNVIWLGTIGAGLFGFIGSAAGGDKGGQWGAFSGAIGGIIAGLTYDYLGPKSATLLGLSVATAIFIFTYKKSSELVTEFNCLPWQAPVGGQNCQLCNEFEECSDYTCKSLGQACDLVNQGTPEQKCVWKNPHDVKSPIIEFKEVSKDHGFKPDKSIRPPATGVRIKPADQDCIKAFFPLEFKFITNEPAQCKIDYNLTNSFENMNFYVNGDSFFKYNHTEKLSLPGPDALKTENPELKTDGEYTLFIRCQDANGNFNQDAFSVNFCVEKGPDTTPPVIANVNIPSNNPVQYNQTGFDLEVYVNEPSECKWSRTDQSYGNMETSMKCDTRVFQMNNKNLYTCKTTLTGIETRKENKYYFRCKDQPLKPEGDRNVNTQSYQYVIIGTQPLNILSITPNETIKGASDTIPVFIKVKTDNGYKNGEALCYYYNDNENKPPIKEENYVLFHDTKSSEHTQRQDLIQGNYVYYIKCVDLGGNAVYDSTRFSVEVDRTQPKVVRAYKETDLKIITDEKAECTYSNNNCNFEIESGLSMNTIDNKIHNTEWIINKNYYIRCKDKYDNQPYPNSCSIILRPSETKEQKGFLEFGY